MDTAANCRYEPSVSELAGWHLHAFALSYIILFLSVGNAVTEVRYSPEI